MPRCPKCNKNVDRLYKGYCTGCISMFAREEVKKAQNEEFEDDYIKSPPTSISEPGGFARLVRQKGNAAVQGEAKSNDHQRKYSINYLRSVERSGLSEKEQLAYMPSLKALYNKYKVMFIRGEYRFCKKDDYGKRADGGVVIDTRGGIVVYKNTSYFDPNKQIADSYAKDDDIIEYEDGSDIDMLVNAHESQYEVEDGHYDVEDDDYEIEE